MPLFFLIAFFVFFLGACVFSFVNVVVYRLPRKLNYISGHSACPHCGNRLNWYHNIPLFSFIALRGKCGFCKEKIACRYVCFEIAGGVLSLFTFLYYIHSLNFDYMSLLRAPLVFLLLSALMAVAFIDQDTMEIPNGLSILIAVLGLLSILLFPEISLLDRATGILSVSLPLFLIALAIEGAFGGGDIKLMAATGVFLGWKLNLIALFFALLIGGGYAGYLLLSKKKDRKAHIPFGPFLCAGVALSWFFGGFALNWYLGFFGF